MKVDLVALGNTSILISEAYDALTPYLMAGSPLVDVCSAEPSACQRFSRIEAPTPRMSPARRQTARRF